MLMCASSLQPYRVINTARSFYTNFTPSSFCIDSCPLSDTLQNPTAGVCPLLPPKHHCRKNQAASGHLSQPDRSEGTADARSALWVSKAGICPLLEAKPWMCLSRVAVVSCDLSSSDLGGIECCVVGRYPNPGSPCVQSDSHESQPPTPLSLPQ